MSSKPVYQRRPRYRQVSTQVFADEKFCQLSRPKPSGQSLWLFLLLGPHTRALPGLFSAGRAALAEALGWTPTGFGAAWHEIETLGMAQADWTARVVWMPNAIRHNPPPNPNVIRGWRSDLSDVPECYLKNVAVEAIGSFCKSLGEPFAQALREALGDGSLNGSRNGFGNGSPNGRGIQEQEQDQYKEPPNPLERGLGTVSPRRPRYTRKDLAEAKVIRKGVGRCTHDPPHRGSVECEVAIALALATRRQAAETETLRTVSPAQ